MTLVSVVVAMKEVVFAILYLIIFSKHIGAQYNAILSQNSVPCNSQTFCSVLPKKENTLYTVYWYFSDSLLNCNWKISNVLKSRPSQNTLDEWKKKKNHKVPSLVSKGVV